VTTLEFDLGICLKDWHICLKVEFAVVILN
jgi:hypothetical protein